MYILFYIDLTGYPKAGGFYTIKFLKLKSECNIEPISIEVNLRKWSNGSLMVLIILLKASYQIILRAVIASLINMAKKHQSFLFFGDFNVSTNEVNMTEFCALNELASLINNKHVPKF